MYDKILVPLDGSRFGENVLPRLQGMISRGEVRSVLLVRVARPVPSMVHRYILDPETITSSEDALRRGARLYLEEIEQRLEWGKVEHRTEVLWGSSEKAIAMFAEKEKADLIMIGERSRRTLFHWAHRCLAYKLLHATPVPVEVYGPETSKE